MTTRYATAGGLRERKKAKTRAAIRREAFRLFREQGYVAATVEQIAAAAEVSESTFFRYFPAKEDVVLQDDFDPFVIEALQHQPAGLSAVGALRGALHEAFAQFSGETLDQLRLATSLASTVPELRARMLGEFARTIEVTATALAKRFGRAPDDFALRTVAGAVLGVGFGAWFAAGDDLEEYIRLLDAGLAHLDAGLPL